MLLRLVTVAMALICFSACSQKTTKEPKTIPSSVTIVPQPSNPSTTPKAENKSDSANQSVCELGTEKRTLRIAPVQPKGCDLWYSNFGKETPVASSRLAMNHCQKTHDSIVEKLTAAGYKCKVAGVAVSSTPAPTPVATPAATPKPVVTPSPVATPVATPSPVATPKPVTTPAPTPSPSPTPVKK